MSRALTSLLHRAARVELVVCAAILLTGCGQSPRPDPVIIAVTENVATKEAPGGTSVALIVENGLPGESYTSLTPDGAWCRFGDPRAVTVDREFARTFVGYVTSAGDVEIAQYDHATGGLSRTVVAEELQQDDRASPSILVRPDGRLMVFYCGHRGRWMTYRTGVEAEGITEWGSVHAASGHTSKSSGYTYPCALVLAGESDRRYLFWRGDAFHPMLSVSTTGLEWSEPTPLIRDGGDTPYFKVASDGDSVIHFVFSDDHPRRAPENSIYYLRYERGVFTRADGSVVGAMEDLPLALTSCDRVYDAGGDLPPAWPWDLAFDDAGHPVIAYAVFPTETDHRYRYARWDGGAWVDSEIVEAGSWFPTVRRGHRNYDPMSSGGVTIDHSDPSVVYLSRPVEGVFEIERWSTSDAGRSWVAEAVTAGSEHNNVRPLVPVGSAQTGPQVIWMNGPYTDNKNYSTSLRMK